ncbi:Serine/threonine-protein kinase plk4 [Dermatophagoides pteronyssinus]|uniref:Serine/threonine-protein kinase plk4 n=1 Tax=Dermatophagoides pteronyssinus TaxID=6956 RepID=A0ABQ8JUP4_DERPT|nr:Serine/threonine-protein kinase plk4 [Dermatophagoides pteronyssinus]
MKIKSKSKSKSKSMNKIKSRSFQNNDQQQQQQLFSSLTYENQLILNKSSSLTTLKTSKSTETIIDEYLRRKQIEPLEIIGEGGFSTVYKVRYLNQNNNNGHIYAAKVMNLNETNRIWVTKCLKHEMFISKLLQHPNIVRTYDYFKTNTYAVIIMEYYSNGSIRLEMDRQNHPYDIGEAGRLFTGLITGLQYMHSKNIAHRDLKLDNFFLDNNRQPLIGDFGFAAIGIKQGRLIIEHLIRQTRCGSDADVYSMGVCLYEMLHQKLPNIDMTTTTNSNTSLKSSSLKSLSFATNINERWQNLIKSMLNLEPNERPTVEMISYQISTPLFRIMTMVQSTIIKKRIVAAAARRLSPGSIAFHNHD